MAHSVALLFDPIYLEHDPGPGHPERPERLPAVIEALEQQGIIERTLRVESRPATGEELCLCHSERYVRLVEREVAAGRRLLSTGDTNLCERSFDAALRAAGGALEVVDAVLSGRARRGFCAVRPPGHHARPEQGMGFCIFNNVAVAARYAQRRGGLGRVLIADWDVHHGNGTQDIFYEDGSVFFFSTHQRPWYPGTGAARETGAGPGRGTTLNVPFPAGAGRAEIVGAFRDKLLPAARAFRPELVFISAGFDSRRGDPLGGFQLDDEDFAELTRIVREVAAIAAGDRVVSVLEGGYALEGLASAAAAHVEALL